MLSQANIGVQPESLRRRRLHIRVIDCRTNANRPRVSTFRNPRVLFGLRGSIPFGTAFRRARRANTCRQNPATLARFSSRASGMIEETRRKLMRPQKNDVVVLTSVRIAVLTLTIAALFASGLTASFARTRTAGPKGALNEAQIVALQKKFQKASLDGDMPALSALLTDNATLIHGNGLVQTKAEYINSITSGKMKFSAYDLKESKVIFFKDGAIIVGAADIGFAPSHDATAAPHLLHMRISSVWLRKLDGWQLIVSQDTPLGAPPSR